MTRTRSPLANWGLANRVLRRLSLAALILGAALIGVTAASASSADSPILNQSIFTDAVGDAGTGPDLSGLTVTTFADGTITFAVSFANRQFLQSNETVQIFIDLNDDGTADLNLSIWPTGQPSYLDRSTGTGWTDIRQLPELVQTPGGCSVHISLSDLQSAAAVPVAPIIQVAVGAWPDTAISDLSSSAANDWIPNATSWDDHSINAPAPTTTTTTSTTPAKTTPASTTPAKTAASPKSTTAAGKATPPVTIERLAPLTVKPGKDVTLRVLLKSRSGPVRLFKVCAQVQPGLGVTNLTQCRSTRSSGAHGAVPFTITYRISHPGTTQVAISASAGTAWATAKAVVHVL